MKMVKSTLAVLTTAAVLGVSGFAQAGSTLDAVQKKGFVQCGISDGLPGFSYADEKGNYLGLDVDVCRAVAAAVFGDATKVKYSPLTAKERFTALQSGEVDILSRNTTWTSSRDAALGLNFEQFTRAVLLAQSEFSAFLKADDKERSELLEKLTNTAIYSQLGRRAYSKSKDAEEAHKTLIDQAQGVMPMADEARAELDQRVGEAQRQLKAEQARPSQEAA